MASEPLTQNQRYAAYLALVLGTVATLLMAYQFNKKGFSWALPLVFNWHPVLMTAAWMGASVWAALAYRVLPVSHDTAKAVHGSLHVLTLILWSIALAAVLKSHNDANPPLQNFYSLHSWFGLATIAAFSLNVSGQSSTTAAHALHADLVPCLSHRSSLADTLLLHRCAVLCWSVHRRLRRLRVPWRQAGGARCPRTPPRSAGQPRHLRARRHHRAAGRHGVPHLHRRRQGRQAGRRAIRTALCRTAQLSHVRHHIRHPATATGQPSATPVRVRAGEWTKQRKTASCAHMSLARGGQFGVVEHTARWTPGGECNRMQ